jgi:serine/threonine protein kinase
MSDDDLLLGRVLQGYELKTLIGQGSVGRVYAAEHTILKKSIAIKIIRPELMMNQRILARFFQESQTVSLIHHENVIEIFDFLYEPENQLVAIFMEHLHGQTLSASLRAQSPFSLPRLGRIAMQLCSALAKTHEAGIIHRDLKSDNIFLINRAGLPDFVKILDFGLVRPQTSLYGIKTPMGTAIGTPLYMPPEQALGDPVDARSDIYSLGVILYEMAAGRLPFYSTDSREVMRKQILVPPPPPRNYNPTLPQEIEQIILRCLAKRKDGRFSSMGELAEALAIYIDLTQPAWPDTATPQTAQAVHPNDTITEETSSINPDATLEE